MKLSQQNIKIIFGLKLKDLRESKGLSLSELAEKSGMSTSYLTEIEKGKKYPKADKVMLLASVLNTTYDKMVSLKLSKKLEPVEELISTGLIDELPLEMFGLESNKLMEIISNAPVKFGAFISSVIELSRVYEIGRMHFYNIALRAYQQMHENYFPELENHADECRKKFKTNVKGNRVIEITTLLKQEYNIEVLEKDFSEIKDVSTIRSLLVEDKNVLLINKNISDQQKCFAICREMGFRYLGITKNRPLSFPWIDTVSFEIMLNNFKASYFANALLNSETEMVSLITKLFARKTYNPELIIKFIDRQQISPETLFHRLTNILPQHFGLNNLFFLRFSSPNNNNKYHITKELHLSTIHKPHSNRIHEHYCRRWVAINAIKDLKESKFKSDSNYIKSDIQISNYLNSNDNYLCLTLAKPSLTQPGIIKSVTIGLQINNNLEKKIAFAKDTSIITKTVNATCERCPLSDCKERAAEALVLDVDTKVERIGKGIEALKLFAK